MPMFKTVSLSLCSATLLGGALIGGAFLSTPAAAFGEPQVCGPRETIIQRLSGRYSESQSAIGMTSGGSLVELFISPAGTWTFVHTQPDGVTCLLAAGENWEEVVPVVMKDDDQPS